MSETNLFKYIVGQPHLWNCVCDELRKYGAIGFGCTIEEIIGRLEQAIADNDVQALCSWNYPYDSITWTIDKQYILLGLAKAGELNGLKWFYAHEHRLNAEELSCVEAGARKGKHIEIFEWLYSLGFPPSVDWCACAALIGDLNGIKWLQANGVPWSAEFATYAASGGHIEIIKWMSERDPNWYSDAMCEKAIKNGHLDMIKYLRSIGCKWDWRSYARAGESGSMEMLKWVHSHNFPDAPYMTRRKDKKEFPDILSYAKERGIEIWDHSRFKCDGKYST